MKDWKTPEEPRARRRPGWQPSTEGIPEPDITPDEPFESERSKPTATRTIRDGEIQGHEREMPGDRDSQ